MRDATERTTRFAGENLWIPAGLGRTPACLAVAALSVFAFVAVFVTSARLTMTVQPSATGGYGVDGLATAAGPTAAPGQGGNSATPPAAKVPDCAGDGTSGNRIQFYYAYFAGQENGIGAARKNLIHVIEQANGIVYRSAQQHGLPESVRVVTDSNCVPDVRAIELPTADAHSFAGTVRDAHLAAVDRKYVLFADNSYYCHPGAEQSGPRSGTQNAAQDARGTELSVARVDLGCWTGDVTAQEILRLLGGTSATVDSSFLYGTAQPATPGTGDTEAPDNTVLAQR